MDLDQPLTELGGIDARRFMQRHWQRRPLLVRQALDVAALPVDRERVLQWAARDDLPSRLVRRPSTAGRPWRVVHGPFADDGCVADGEVRPRLPALARPQWTVLVQDVHTQVPELARLMRRFRFVPDARLDDVMVSFATRGGGVGPHVDSYDVFLLQARGRRRWRIGALRGAAAKALVPDQPLKLLARFEPQQEFDLGPGDMLYLPPGYGHDGVALDDHCVTCSIGFRAPSAGELLAQWLEDEAERIRHDPAWQRLYSDRGHAPTDAPERLPQSMVDFMLAQWTRLRPGREQAESVLGRYLSEPKPHVFFDPPRARPRPAGDAAEPGSLRLDDRTQIHIGRRSAYVNGERHILAGPDLRLLASLARRRRLDGRALLRASAQLLALLRQWQDDGWLHPSEAESGEHSNPRAT
jgi:50S ribosomal protein L16 3-hydroxylase